MSRLIQLNTRLTLPLLHRTDPVFGDAAGTFGGFASALSAGCFSVRYRIPPSVMPRSAFQQTHRGEPPAPDRTELGESVDCVLATGGREPTGRWPQRRNRVAVELNHEDRCPRDGRPCGHLDTPERNSMRWSAVLSSCSNRVDGACRLLGNARITTRSAGPRSSRMVRAACRSRRDTWCRWTALPTALDTTRPILGPDRPAPSDRVCTTMFGCVARVP